MVQTIPSESVELNTSEEAHQLDQDYWFACRSDSDYKERAFASTAASTSLPVSAKDSWENGEDHVV